MSVTIVIPARYGSSRFPGKPLHPVLGISLLERVYRLASAVSGVGSVVIATDDDRIRRHAETLGARVVMTPASCRNGTERIGAALELLPDAADVVVNFQGDAVLTPPWILQPLVDLMAKEPQVRMATPAVAIGFHEVTRLVEERRAGQTGGTTVVFNRHQDALYFSKSVIPHLRNPGALPDRLPCYRHIGMYAYRRDTLEELLRLPIGPLEQAEELEQLRALENGIPVRVVRVDYRGRSHASIDNPSDVALTEAIIRREGELLPEFQKGQPSVRMTR